MSLHCTVLLSKLTNNDYTAHRTKLKELLTLVGRVGQGDVDLDELDTRTYYCKAWLPRFYSLCTIILRIWFCIYRVKSFVGAGSRLTTYSCGVMGVHIAYSTRNPRNTRLKGVRVKLLQNGIRVNCLHVQYKYNCIAELDMNLWKVERCPCCLCRWLEWTVRS